MKSKASATTIRKMTETSTGSSMLQDDSFDDVGDILTNVDGFLDPLEYFLPLDQFDGVFLALEESGHGRAQHVIPLVFQRVDLHAGLEDHLGVLLVPQGVNDHLHLGNRLRQ